MIFRRNPHQPTSAFSQLIQNDDDGIGWLFSKRVQWMVNMLIKERII